MARLVHDPYLSRGRQHPARRRGSALLILLMLVSLLLIVLNRLDHPAARLIKAAVVDVISPAASWSIRQMSPIHAMSGYFESVSDLRHQLAAERANVARLREAEWQAHEASRKLAEVEQLARMAVARQVPFRSARVISEPTGPFARSLVIDVGGEHGIRTGHPVVSTDGVVGRIIEVGERASRVLLLTDIASRVPVLIGTQRTRAIATGDTSTILGISFTDRDAQIKAGDVVVTSGVGGHFPAGLKVGRVVASERTLRINPFADLDRLEHVSVLIVESPIEPLGTAERTLKQRPVRADGKTG